MLRRWFIEILGGFPDADTLVRHIDGTHDEKEARIILQRLVKKLFNTIGPDDILRATAHGWTLKGRPLTEAEVTEIRAEAKQFENSKIWRILSDELRYHSNVKMYEKSETALDITAGKLLLYLTDVVSTKMHQIAK